MVCHRLDRVHHWHTRKVNRYRGKGWIRVPCSLRCSKTWAYKSRVAEFYWRTVCSLSGEEEDSLEYALRGKAWKVYWFLLKNGRPLTVREVQKGLRFSSPSVAQHHLEQLCELGLAQKQNVGGQYFLASEVKIGVLRHFVKLGKLLFPRYFFYALFSTTFYVAYLLLLMQGFTRENLFIAVFGAVVSAVFWYEAARIWSLKPF